MLLLELQGQETLRAQVLDPASGDVPVTWASAAIGPVAIAGPYAAGFSDSPCGAALVDLATGAQQAAFASARDGWSVDVAADGRIVVRTDAGLETARPGEPPQLIPTPRR